MYDVDVASVFVLHDAIFIFKAGRLALFISILIPTYCTIVLVERNTPELLQCDDDSMIVTDSYDATLFTSIF